MKQLDGTRLIIADSEHNADMLYASGMFVPDAFIAIEMEGQWHGLFSPLEVDRAKKDSKLHEAHLDTPWRQQAEADHRSGLAAVAAAFLQHRDITQVMVPGDFPLAYAEKLRSWGFKVDAVEGAFFPGRAVKSEYELRCLAQSERLTRQSMQQAEAYLAQCGVGDDGILRAPDTAKKVKSADVRRVIETFLIGRGAMPAHTIVACGKEGADPHNIGHGFIRAHQTIIIDIFPRMLATGYWGDMTRSYVKGKASPEIKRLYQTVREGQDIGLSMVASGVDGTVIHQRITDHFDTQGYPTKMVRGKQTGFFHGTGHGVGLQIHEAPGISVRSNILQANQVVTVEPGLYYPGLGGIRLEDMVIVRDGGCDNLTKYKRKLEIA
ncbi:aminopeptidase P family protein [Mariprofundus sp. EBB-1]|uniref:M24 family metallopeptidase n=1 Tax=Mariprofundus sp. EBB-1 TaxID=2650971 RepID=UPI000EF1F8E5|nr:Xaa-Pro peptidase family protein [Mariprofundus sp. EBB-1]RLL55635.1 aminopeptidase P family protein [Mariprofundus sp. EBB-1]